MSSGDTKTDPEVLDELLRFSRAFYEAFRIRRNRIRNWRFLLLLLSKEESDPDHQILENFSPEEIKTVLGWEQAPDNVERWRQQLIKQFQDERGNFLKKVGTYEGGAGTPGTRRAPGRPASVRVHKFSSHFESAARNYVKGVVTKVLHIPVEYSVLEHVVEQKGGETFRKLMQIIKEHYFPIWETLFNELAAAVSAPRTFQHEWNERAPYWVISLVAWKQFIEDPGRPFDTNEFVIEVRHALRSVDRDEVVPCLDYMQECGILRIDASLGDKRYAITDPCKLALRNYTSAMRAARPRLISLFADEIEQI